MKEKTLLLIAATLAISFTGCSNSELEQLKKENSELKARLEQVEETTISKNSTELANEVLNNTPKSENEYEITKYSFVSDYGTSYCAAAVLKNTTKDIVNAKVDILLKDTAGNIIGVSNQEIDLLVPNREIVVWTTNETNFTDFDVNISYSEPYNKSLAIDDNVVKISENQVGNKIVFTTTNTSNKKVRTDNETILFFKDNKVVDLDTVFLDHVESIEPSQTSYTEVESSVDSFDSYKLYYSGYFEN